MLTALEGTQLQARDLSPPAFVALFVSVLGTLLAG